MKKGKAERSHTTIIATAIFAIVALHFAVSQFISFQTQQTFLQNEAINQPAAEIKTESYQPADTSPAKPDMINLRETVTTAPAFEHKERRIAAPTQTTVRKKENRTESSAERLRRAEKLLTGI